MRLAMVVISLVLTVPLAGQDGLTRTDEVRYASKHDPGWIVLEGGREIRVRWEVPGHLTFDDVDKWVAGKALSIALSSNDGPVLLDPASGRTIPIIAGLDTHPIDSIVEKCLRVELTTQGMVGCYSQGLRLWDREMNRLYGDLMKSLSGDQRKAVQDAQQGWLKYRDVQVAAITKVYTQGSISLISRADEVLTLTKEHTQRLARFAAEL